MQETYSRTEALSSQCHYLPPYPKQEAAGGRWIGDQEFLLMEQIGAVCNLYANRALSFGCLLQDLAPIVVSGRAWVAVAATAVTAAERTEEKEAS